MTLPRRDAAQEIRRPRGKVALIAAITALALACSGFTALGLWQLHRLDWKLALIERVESRIHAPAVDAPVPSQWSTISAASDEYKRIRLQGRFLPGHDTRVQALTRLGAGFWILSPFRTPDGNTVLVNRGFVPEDWKGDNNNDNSTLSAVTEVTGLLRLSEPGGGFLRRNQPAADRWYSRDVQAIAAARGLPAVAPYFVDAEADVDADSRNSTSNAASATLGAAGTATAESWPRAGLTVTSFSNNHRGYALTWFVLALMCAAAAVYLLRHEWRQRH